jgi:hypothetical protein
MSQTTVADLVAIVRDLLLQLSVTFSFVLCLCVEQKMCYLVQGIAKV